MAKLVRRGGSPAAQKIVAVNAAQNSNIATQQGTTRIIYDSVKLSTTTDNNVVTLFQDCRTRKFPLTNLTENKLQKGETLAVQRISFYIMETTTGTTNAVGIFPLAYFGQFQGLYCGQYSLIIGTSQVLKTLPVFSTYAPFNPDAKFVGLYQAQAVGADLKSWTIPHDNFEMKNDLVIPQDIEFQVNIQIPPLTLPTGFDYYLGMYIEGLGSLYSPKANY